jgi:hypothetical protein
MPGCLRFLAGAAAFTIVVSGDFVPHSSAQAPVGQTEPQEPTRRREQSAGGAVFKSERGLARNRGQQEFHELWIRGARALYCDCSLLAIQIV